MATGPSSLANLLHHYQTGTEPAHILAGQMQQQRRRNSQEKRVPARFSSQPAAVSGPDSASTSEVGQPVAGELAETASRTSTRAAHHKTTSGLYQCAHCQKRYSRPEHLARHIQAHTLGKRFACQICGKAFARQDLLKRHVANHDNDNDPTKKRRRTASSPNSARVANACKACAAARVKCEETKPCARCRTRKLTCDYGSSQADSFPGGLDLQHPASLDASPESTIHGTQIQGGVPEGSIDSFPAPVQSEPRSFANPVWASSLDAVNPQNALPQGLTVQDSFAHPRNTLDIPTLPFSDFLQNVIYEPATHSASKMEDSQGGLAVLDFNSHVELDLAYMDFDLLDSWNLDLAPSNGLVQTDTPNTDDIVDLASLRQKLFQVWQDSPWCWHPTGRHSAFMEESNLPDATRGATATLRESRKRMGSTIPGKLGQSQRDAVMAILLESCTSHEMTSRVATSFPGVDMLDSFVHIFLASHFCQTLQWIHQATFELNAQRADWIAMVAAYGATLTPAPTLRKWGFAVQEAIRVALPKRVDSSNDNIKHKGLVQSLVLNLDMALWSGNRRKAEIAECHLAIPVSMMRFRDRFQRSSYPPIDVSSVEGDELVHAWKSWCERESWKRLVFHCFVRDAQSSMASIVTMPMSYSELTMPLPESRALWFARSATEWKSCHIEQGTDNDVQIPSLKDVLRDVSLLVVHRNRLDVQSVFTIYLHGFWALVREYWQLCSVLGSRSWLSEPVGTREQILRTRHGELCEEMRKLQLVAAELDNVLTVKEHLMLHLLAMNLYLSLEDLQLFSGKEGEDEARRIYGNLREWVQSCDGRRALWHAGQVLRYAKLFPQGHLKDFYAVAVHHAALAFWAYGVVTKTLGKPAIHFQGQTTIYLDAPSHEGLVQFIELGQGRILIQGMPSPAGALEAAVEDPRACSAIAQEILGSNFKGKKDVPPAIVANMCQLLKQLGDAAWAVGLA